MTIAESSPGVTVGTSNNNKGRPGSGSVPGPIASEARAQARARPSLTDDHRALLTLWFAEACKTARKLSGWLEGNGFLREHPASFASRLTYARQAPMAGSSKFLRGIQRVDAYTVGAIGVAVFYVLAWIWDRPLRRYVALTVAALVWLLH